jgi:hypothetical protein
MAFSVSTAALTRGAQAATFRGHFPVARKSGQRQVDLPSTLDETPPISRPLVLADQGVVESLSFAPPYAFRLSEMMNAACKQSTRRPALACERGTSVNPPSYTRARR